MYVYLPLTIFTIVLSLYVEKNPAGSSAGVSRTGLNGRGITRQTVVDIICLLGIFISLFLVSALRVNVGNDYMRYVEFMHRANVHSYVATEWGFNSLTRLIYFISGFENYLAVFAAFAFFTILFFLAALKDMSVDFTLSFMLFMLLGYYFQSISTVRYYLALSIAFYAMRYALSGDWPRFLLFVLCGSLFHKSLLLVIIMYPVAIFRWRRWMFGLFALLCVSCLFLSEWYLKLAVMLYPSYAESAFLSGGTSLVSIARCAGVTGFALIVYRKDLGELFRDRVMRFYFMCNMFALLLYTFGSFLPTVSRIAYYLTVTQLVFIPALIARVPDEIRQRVYKHLTVAAGIVYFAMYMYHAGDDGVRVLPYQSILFHELPPTLSERGGGLM